MLRVTIAGLLSHKLRLSLTALAIILGVAFVAAVLIFTDTINAVFGNIQQTAAAGVSVTVRGQPLPGGGGFEGGGREPVPASLLTAVRKVSGVRNAVGVVRRPGITFVVNGAPLTTTGAPTFGTGWVNDPQLTPFRLRSGHPPSGRSDVCIDAHTASAHHLRIGDRLTVVFRGSTGHLFTVTCIAGYGSGDTAGGAGFALFDADTAQRVLDAGGRYDEIDCSAAAGVADQVLRDRIAAVLPPSVDVATGAAAAAQTTAQVQSRISLFLGTPLLVFAGISLFVGTFLIVNTFTILVAQRSRELALLRALGATRRQVLASLLTEAVVTGLVASAAGSLLGLALAALLFKALALQGGSLTLAPRTFIVAIAAGTAVTTLAAALPSLRATRIPPVAALREAEPEVQHVTRLRIAAGAAVSGGGIVLLGIGLFAGTSTALQLIGAGALLVFVGVALLSPVLVRPVAAVVGWPVARLRGLPGRLARENAERSPRRTASTAAALMIGVALVTCIGVIGRSFEVSAFAVLDGSISAQLLVTQPSASEGAGFSPDAAQMLSRDRAFTNVTELRVGSALVGGTGERVEAIDPHAVGRTLTLDAVSGDVSGFGGGSMLLDEQTASAHGWTAGQTLTVGFPGGATRSLRVAAIIKGSVYISGVIVALETYAAAVTSPRDVAVLLDPAPGTTLSAATAHLQAVLKAYPTLQGTDKKTFESQEGQRIQQLLDFIYALLVLSVVIAGFGIMNTLFLSIVERTRELGLLRAVGSTRTQVRSMIRWEAVIVALLGACLGIVIGVGLGVAMVRSLADSGIDHIAVDTALIVEVLVAAFVLGLVAAALPAWRAGRLDVLRAIAME